LLTSENTALKKSIDALEDALSKSKEDMEIELNQLSIAHQQEI
jgi:hypothetical protein